MAFGATPGIITDGPGADSFRSIIPIRYSLTSGNQVFPGACFKRNLLQVVGRNDTYPQYSNGDQGVLPTSASSGFVAGVYRGTAVTNASGASASVGLGLVRQGVTPVRVGALNGGTAITVGSLVGFSAATGAASYDIPTIQTYTIGAMIGYVTGYQIATALQTAVTATGSQTVSVMNTDGITTSTAITLDYGNNSIQEAVTPSAVTAQVKANGTFTPTVVSAAAGTVITVTIGGVAATYTTVSGDTTATLVGTHVAAAINASAIVNGSGAVIAPAVAVSGVVYFTALTGGTGNNSITLTATSSSTGNYTVAVSAATFANGTYGTVTATFQYTHTIGAIVIGQNLVSGGSIIPVPAATGGFNIDTVLVDVAIVGA